MKPPIVCICGSTRFKQTWIAENARFTGEGYIVLAVGLWGHHERVFPDAETKKRLDELHLRKIDLCDWVWVLDIGGYIGESTRNEIAYAKAHGKEVRYLSKEFPDYVEPIDPILSRAETAEKERDEARQSAIDSHADAVKAVAGQLREIRKTEATEQQVKNLEEYMLRGVAFRDELQAQLAEKERALCRARETLQQLKDGRDDIEDLRAVNALTDALSSSSPCPHEEEAKRPKEEAVEKAACGPRLDPSKCSGCNGTGIGNCICGGKGTVEGERDGYKVAALKRIRRIGPEAVEMTEEEHTPRPLEVVYLDKNFCHAIQYKGFNIAIGMMPIHAQDLVMAWNERAARAAALMAED